MGAKKKAGEPVARRASEYDAQIGVNLRQLRGSMSQSKLGELIGVKFQQVQKYEDGSNRIALVTALRICKALSCDISRLIAGVDIAA